MDCQSARATSIGWEVGHPLVGPRSATPPPCSLAVTLSQPGGREEERGKRREKGQEGGKRREGSMTDAST